MYSKKALDSDRAAAFLDLDVRQQSQFPESEGWRLPDEMNFSEIIIRVEDSAATGSDGVSSSACKACPLLSSKVLVNCVSDLASEQPAGDLAGFNRQLVCFAPGGIDVSGGTACTRPVENLRTILGSNSDSKLLAGAVSHMLVSPTLKVFPEIQRGFCKGRHLSLNIVGLDLYMHEFDCKSERRCRTFSPEMRLTLSPEKRRKL